MAGKMTVVGFGNFGTLTKIAVHRSIPARASRACPTLAGNSLKGWILCIGGPVLLHFDRSLRHFGEIRIVMRLTLFLAPAFPNHTFNPPLK
jgi:hypothetical protein